MRVIQVLKTSAFCSLSLMLVLSCSAPQQDQSPQEPKTSTPEETAAATDDRKTILFFGNSITAGYLLNLDEAFPALIQDRIDSLGYNYQVINAGLSGETTASGKSRIDWVLRTIPDLFVLELGANDGLRGLPLEESQKNLQEIIDAVRSANPEVKILLAGMQVPPNLGPEYTETFKEMFPQLAKENQIGLIPFILEGVAGDPRLNLEDGIHPTPEGHAILAETVWKYLEPLLEKAS